jgi:hypothetical protein
VVSAVISDLHLGSGSQSDLLRRPEIIERLIDRVGEADQLVLLGDTLELRDGPIGVTLERSQRFFEEVGRAFAGRRVVLVPGNHDHKLLGHWLERVRDGNGSVALDEVVAYPHPCVEQLDEWLGDAELMMRYPGVWLRDDVFATHGHYLDSHLTLPTVERLSIATVDRIGGRPTGSRSGPEDYEKVQAPVYDLLFDLAQGARNPQAHKISTDTPSMRIWEMIGGASGRARNLRGRLLRSAVIPATLKGLERAGLGRFSRDFSLGEIGRAGVEAMHVAATRLEVEAEHLVFGHIHRRGPLPGEDGRSAADPEWERRGRQLHNTGSWVYEPAMLARANPNSAFWPGHALLIGETGPPEPIAILDDVPHAELEPPGRRS